MPPNDSTAEGGSARLSLGKVAVIVDRIRRTPGLEADADALQRHLAAVENDGAWASYVERTVVAIGASAQEQAAARAALQEVRQAVDASARALAEAVARIDVLRDELKVMRDAREHAAVLAADVDRVRITGFYDKIAGPLIAALATLLSLTAAHYLGMPLPAPGQVAPPAIDTQP